MLLFFFPVHAETWLKAVVATVSVIATWKHVGVVVDVKVVASVLEKSDNLQSLYLDMHRKGRGLNKAERVAANSSALIFPCGVLLTSNCGKNF